MFWPIAAIVATALGIGLVIASKHQVVHQTGVVPPSPQPSSQPSPASAVAYTTTMRAGHRYQIQQLAPIPVAPVATVQATQTMFDTIAPGAIRVVSITAASNGNPTTLIIDAVRDFPITLPSTMPITDLGQTPTTPFFP